MIKKKGLGKGLSALISDEIIEDIKKETIENIDIKLIVANKNQPRQDFEEEALEDLTNSIKLHGLIQPIIVRKVKNKYEIIAGERRYRASKAAGIKEIPCIIRDISTETSAKLALIENIQRKDLNPIEEAKAYKKLMENYNLTQETLSKEVGKSRSYVANTIRLLNLDEEIIDYIAKGELTSSHGKVLLGIKDKDEQLNAAKRIMDKDLNVRETEKVASEKNKSKKPKTIDTSILEVEENLMKALGTKVNIVQGNKKGRIEIEFYGYEDLERIIELLSSSK